MKKPALVATACGSAFLLLVIGLVFMAKPVGPAIKISALDLYQAYANNEASADSKYTGRRVEISLPYQTQFHKPLKEGSRYGLILRHPFNWDVGMAAPPPLVFVQLSAKEAEKLDGSQGRQMTITGICRGLSESDLIYGRYVGLADGSISLSPAR